MVKRPVPILIVLGWLLGTLLPVPAYALQLSQRVDRHILYPDETFFFTVQADQPLPAEALDIRPLFAGFVIGQLQFTILDAGQQSRWIIPLTVRADQPFGLISLPALQVADQHTRSVSLRFQAGPVASPPTINVLEGRLLQAPTYAGSPGLYRLRIKLLPGIIIDKIAPPMLAHATVTTWGEDQHSSEQLDGHQVPVLERWYLVRPQQTGRQTLLGAQIEGRSNMPVRGAVLREASPDIALDVPPLPHGASLPSEQLQLSAHWITETDNAQQHAPPQVGDPLRFALTLQGLGNLAEDLPTLAPVDTPAWKFYLEHNQPQTRRQGSTLQGTRTLIYLAIPQQAGRHSLPALTLAWWNSRQHRQEMATASLPTPDISPAAGVSVPETAPISPTTDGMALLRYLASMLVVATLGTLLWRAPGFARWREHALRRWQQHQCWNQIQQAVQQQDAHATHHAILAWARLRWPQASIPGLTTMPCYPELATELDALLAACYAPESPSWQGNKLLQGLRRWHPTISSTHANLVNPDGLF